MRTFDLIIRGGTVVDGTGVPRYKADVAIKDGRIAMISGVIKAGAAKELDASGCIVAPGAIDLHTHYDAQLNWDPYATLSGWFGVTSLTIGMCGFGFAPTRPDDRDQNMRMMDRIEAIPLESMRKGMRWDWETFPEFLDSLERHGLGVNVGSVFPFSPLRAYVLGMQDSRERTSVTDAELDQMQRIFREAMEAGAFGFSADKNLEDRPEDGSALPSHVASPREFLGLADVLGDFGVGQIAWTSFLCADPEENHALMLEMMERSGRPLHVVPLPQPDPVTAGDSRLPASYANFYVANGVLLVPLYGGPKDQAALDTLATLFPGRRVTGIDARALILGLGGIHCVTQQQPLT